VHYPTDSSLLVDGVRVLTRGMKRIESATRSATKRVRNRMRAASRRLLEIGVAARSIVRKQSRERLERGYRRLLGLRRAAVRDAERIVSELAGGTRAPISEAADRLVQRARRSVEATLPLIGRVIAQARARIFGSNTRHPDKLLSLFEPHTEAIRKGKAAKPTEFGKFVKIQEAENQIVVDYKVYERRIEDQALLMPAISAHVAIFGSPPRLIAGDRGFWSARNKGEAQAAGVARVCIPAQGRLSQEQRAEQRQRWFRRGQRIRTGCEGRISVLKRRDGLGRCRYRGEIGMKRWVGWGVVSNNLWVLTRTD
jgi:IS5 family transposase